MKPCSFRLVRASLLLGVTGLCAHALASPSPTPDATKSLSTELASAWQEVESLQKQLMERSIAFREREQTLEAARRTLDEQVQRLLLEAEGNQTQLRAAREKLAELRGANQQLSINLADLKGELLALRTEAKGRATTGVAATDLQRKVDELQGNLARRTEEVGVLEARVKLLAENGVRIQELDTKLAEAGARVEALAASEARLTTQLREAESERARLAAQSTDGSVREVTETYERKLTDAETRVQIAEAEVARLRETRLQQAREQEALVAKAGEQQKNLDQLAGVLSDVRRERDQALAQLEDARLASTQLAQVGAAALAEAKARVARLETEQQERLAAAPTVNTEAELTALRQQMADLAVERDRLQVKVIDGSAQVRLGLAAEKERDQLVRDLANVRADMLRLAAEADRAQFQQRQTDQAQLRALAAEVVRLRFENQLRQAVLADQWTQVQAALARAVAKARETSGIETAFAEKR